MPRIQARQEASQASFLVLCAFLSVFRHKLSVIRLYLQTSSIHVLYPHLCLVQLLVFAISVVQAQAPDVGRSFSPTRAFPNTTVAGGQVWT